MCRVESRVLSIFYIEEWSIFVRMLRAILNKSWRQHPTRHQLYGQLPPVTKTIQVRQTRHAGHCWRSKDELISDVLLWTPAYGQAKVGRPAQTYIQQLCEDTGCSSEDLPEAMNDREKWRERVRDIRASGTTWWWWWWWWWWYWGKPAYLENPHSKSSLLSRRLQPLPAEEFCYLVLVDTNGYYLPCLINSSVHGHSVAWSNLDIKKSAYQNHVSFDPNNALKQTRNLVPLGHRGFHSHLQQPLAALHMTVFEHELSKDFFNHIRTFFHTTLKPFLVALPLIYCLEYFLFFKCLTGCN